MGPLANGNFLACNWGDPNHLLYNWDDPPSGMWEMKLGSLVLGSMIMD